MRVRKRKGVEEYLAAHQDIVFHEPVDWVEVFDQQQPLQIEVGCGKGDFIVGMAKKYPEINFVGVDLQETVISWALDKVIASGLTNVKLLLTDGSQLTDYFAVHSVEKLFLNFSDPWPKKRHSKRRLTSASFLAVFQEIVSADSELAFKTDNRGLFEYSLVSLTHFGMSLEQVWLDLHQDTEFAKDNVMTEYERKFSGLGQPIYRLTARFNAERSEEE